MAHEGGVETGVQVQNIITNNSFFPFPCSHWCQKHSCWTTSMSFQGNFEWKDIACSFKEYNKNTFFNAQPAALQVDGGWQLWVTQTVKNKGKNKALSGCCLLHTAHKWEHIGTRILKLCYLQLICSMWPNSILEITMVMYKWQSYCTCILMITSYWTAKWQCLLFCGFVRKQCGLEIIARFIIYELLVFFT